MGTRKNETLKYTKPGSDDGKNSEELRAEIARIRAAMDQTLDALTEKLHPRHVIERATGLLSEAEEGVAENSRKYGRKMLNTVKEHPVPTTLIGAGLAWLLVERSRRNHPDGREQEPPDTAGSSRDRQSALGHHGKVQATREALEQVAERARDTVSGVAEHAKGAVTSAAERTSETASKMAASAGGVASRAASGVASGSRKAGEAVSSAAGQAADWAKSVGSGGRQLAHRGSAGVAKASRKAEDIVRDYPLAAGAAALGLGALLGVMLHSSRRENKWFGEESDEMKSRARDLGHRVADSGKTVATHTAAEVRDEIERLRLDLESLREKAAIVASQTKRAAVNAAEEQGLTPGQLKEKAETVASAAGESAREEIERQAGTGGEADQ